MVALTGGLFVSIAVFALSRDASRFYQRESRVADSTLNAVQGFERLRNDLQRVGFMTTAHLGVDPSWCQPSTPLPNNAGPFIGQQMADIAITPDALAAANPVLQANGITPDQITIAGNFNSVDQFPIWGVQGSPGQPATVFLQTNIGPLLRMAYSARLDPWNVPGSRLALLDGLFPRNRVLRIVDQSGRSHFAVIGGTTGGANPTIQVTNDMPLRYREGTSSPCGLKDPDLGVVNAVEFVRYRLRNLKSSGTNPEKVGANYEYLLLDGSSLGAKAPPFDKERLELVREDLYWNGSPAMVVDPTSGNVTANPAVELIAEYAVDLRFDVTVAGNSLLGQRPIALGRCDTAGCTGGGVGDRTNYVGVVNPTTPTQSRPERVRGLRATVVVRSKEPDRVGNVVGDTLNPAVGIRPNGEPYRYRVHIGRDGTGAGAGSPSTPTANTLWARVRSLTSEIALPNHARLAW